MPDVLFTFLYILGMIQYRYLGEKKHTFCDKIYRKVKKKVRLGLTLTGGSEATRGPLPRQPHLLLYDAALEGDSRVLCGVI